MSWLESARMGFERHLPRVMGARYEPRAAQVDMSTSVAECIESSGVLVAEAETGLGKSLAYLVPLVAWLQESGRRAVVSTHTRHLQGQLADADVPLACSLAGEVKAAVLMGRTNYACKRAINKRLDATTTPAAERAWLRTVLDHTTGELDVVPDASRHLDATLRAAVSCPWKEAICSGCALRHECFLFSARRRALDAQLVLVNHALLFSDLEADGALLGNYDVLVIDEAHHLEDVATSFLSLGFSPRAIRDGAQSIYSPEYEEAISYVRAKIAEEDEADAESVDNSWRAFHREMEEAQQQADGLFARLSGNAGQVLARTKDTSRALGYAEGAPLLYDADAGALIGALNAMSDHAGDIAALCEDNAVLTESGVTGTVQRIAALAAQTREEVTFLMSGSDEDYVFYAQLDDERQVTVLSASPVDVSMQLGAIIEDRGASVLTSATLAVGEDFSYALDRFGLTGGDRLRVRRFATPFDLNRCRQVMVAAGMPPPASPAYLDHAARLIAACFAETKRRTLVLCTSRAQLAGLTRRLLRDPSTAGNVIAQTDGAARADMLARFRAGEGGVLVGLASFWEGVDLPGELLEVVFILKLPFLVPTEPVVRARAQRVSDRGEDPFERLFIPDVVLKTRQGMGRLIRTANDRGAVILLDRRLAHGTYGEVVLSALAERVTRCETSEEVTLRVARLFSGGPPEDHRTG